MVFRGANRSGGGYSAARGGRGGAGARSGGRGRGDAASSSDPYGQTAAPKAYASKIDEHLAKKGLRSYIGEQGPFFLEGADTETAYFEPHAVSRTRTATNCEAMNRMGFFLSFFSSTMSGGADALFGCFGPEGDAAKAGVKQLLDALASPSGEEFLAAMEYFNVKKQMPRSAEETPAHVSAMLAFLGEEPEELHGSAVLLLGVAFRLQLFAAHLVEVQSLLLDISHWADGVSRDTHPPAVGRWKADPQNFELLCEALKAAFEQRLVDERRGSTSVGGSAAKRYTASAGEASSSLSQRPGASATDPYGNPVADDGSESRAVLRSSGGSLWSREPAARGAAAAAGGRPSWLGKRAADEGAAASKRSRADPAAADLAAALEEDEEEATFETWPEHQVKDTLEKIAGYQTKNPTLEQLKHVLAAVPSPYLPASVEAVQARLANFSRAPKHATILPTLGELAKVCEAALAYWKAADRPPAEDPSTGKSAGPAGQSSTEHTLKIWRAMAAKDGKFEFKDTDPKDLVTVPADATLRSAVEQLFKALKLDLKSLSDFKAHAITLEGGKPKSKSVPLETAAVEAKDSMLLRECG